MDAETLKMIGTGSAQIVLAAGYLPTFWLVRSLWKDRAELLTKMIAIMSQQYDDAAKRKDLWDAQGKVIDAQTDAIKDLTREVAAARNDIGRARA